MVFNILSPTCFVRIVDKKLKGVLLLNSYQEKNAGCFGIGFSVIFPIVLKTEDIHPPKTGISVHFLAPLVYRNCKTSLFSRTRSTDSRQVIDN